MNVPAAKSHTRLRSLGILSLFASLATALALAQDPDIIVGATSTKSSPRDSASRTASKGAMMPNCSPSSLITRT